MGWEQCGSDSQGRPIGYGNKATCDHPGCKTEIDRGLDYACGGMHGAGDFSCEKYFCYSHLKTVDNDGKLMTLCLACVAEFNEKQLLRLTSTNQNLAARLKRVESQALDLRRKARISRKRTHLALVGLVARLQIRDMKARAEATRQFAFAHFAADLNAVRLQRGLTLAEVGKKAALSPERVLAICHGDWSSSLGDLVSVCMALRVRANMKLIPIGGYPVQIIPIGPEGKQR